MKIPNAKGSFGEMVDRVFQKVKAHMKWDDAKTRLWFSTENPHFAMLTPDDYMLRRPDKFERAVDAMISVSSFDETRQNKEGT